MPAFDPDALVGVLNASYVPASAANLLRAFSERPELFGGGTIVGSGGDKLRLPNGDVWDLIYAVDNPLIRHYQALPPGGAPVILDDPLRAEPGPLVFLEPDAFATPLRVGTYEGIVARAVAELGAGDSAIDEPRARIVDELSERGGLEYGTSSVLESGAAEIDAQLSNSQDVNIGDVAAATEGLNDDASARRDALPEETEYTAPYLVPPDFGPPPGPGEREPEDGRQPPPKGTPRDDGGE